MDEFENEKKINPTKKINVPKKPELLFTLVSAIGNWRIAFGFCLWTLGYITLSISLLMKKSLLEDASKKSIDISVPFPYLHYILLILSPF